MHLNAKLSLRLNAKLSLTARMTILFAVGSSIVLLVLGWLIGASIAKHFEEQDRDALSGKLMLIQHAVERISSRQELDQLPVLLSDAIVGHHDLIVRVSGPDQRVLLASSKVKFPENIFTHTVNGSMPHLFVWMRGANSYRGLAASFRTRVPSWQPLVVAVAVDIEHHQAFMNTFMQTLWIFVGCAAIVTGLLGWLVASRSLAPLKGMREKAAAVTADKLDQRLVVESVPPELADLARTLNDMLERLEEAFTRLSDFSSDLAHELRTPINNLMMQTQVSLTKDRDAAKYREVLESNAEEYERLARMISDMLFLAKAENGLVLANAEKVDLAREVSDLFEFYEALADEKNLQLKCVGAASVTGDRSMLRRAISNLLSNAIRHTSQFGNLVITISQEENSVKLTVENHGNTIPAEHLGRLFERFYRADPARQHIAGEGTGLGLAITQAIVAAHHGTVSASSKDGLTRFSILVPEKEHK